MVISHCGAGILLESLRADDTVAIAVVNDSLMGNHQSELADRLSGLHHIYQAVPSNVMQQVTETLQALKSGQDGLVKYPVPSQGTLPSMIDDMLLS